MLINYLPPILKEIREFKLVMAEGDKENTDLYTAIADLKNNQYITTMNEVGAGRYEKMLGVVIKGTDTLEDRRFRILSLYNKQLPYTKIRLEQDLTTLCGSNGFTIEINYDNHTLTVKVALTAKTMFDVIKKYLETITPLNMIVDLIFLYNQHLLFSSYTHGQLSGYTHKQLREEIFT